MEVQLLHRSEALDLRKGFKWAGVTNIDLGVHEWQSFFDMDTPGHTWVQTYHLAASNGFIFDVDWMLDIAHVWSRVFKVKLILFEVLMESHIEGSQGVSCEGCNIDLQMLNSNALRLSSKTHTQLLWTVHTPAYICTYACPLSLGCILMVITIRGSPR